MNLPMQFSYLPGQESLPASGDRSGWSPLVALRLAELEVNTLVTDSQNKRRLLALSGNEQSMNI